MNEQATGDTGAWQGKSSGSNEILHDEVGEFCEDLTEQYQGWLVEVANQGKDGQWRVIADRQPLQVISYQAGDGSFDIRIVLGKDVGETFAHVVPDVQTLDYRADSSGAAEELTIHWAEGVTALRFRSPSESARPG